MPFPVRKEIKLDFLGEGWTGAYLAFSGLTFNETREFSKLNLGGENTDSESNMDYVLELLQSHFLEGNAFDGDKLVDLKSSQLGDLPPDVVTKCIELLVGGGNSENLTTS
jgi:hypothetical protein